jgi:hypothetical protein
VLKLYGAGRYFLCGIAIDWPTPRSAKIAATARCRANKVRQQFGGETGMTSMLPDRPKGMHKRTYRRLRSEILNAEMLEKPITILLERLQRSDRRIAAWSHKESWK